MELDEINKILFAHKISIQGNAFGDEFGTSIIAKEANSEIFELNASDFRNKKKLDEILRPALEQQSLTKKNKVILVDEADGVSTVDRGGVTELVSLISRTTYPMIITIIAAIIAGKAPATSERKSFNIPPRSIFFHHLIPCFSLVILD